MIKVLCTRDLEPEYLDEARQCGIQIASQNFIHIEPIISESLQKEIFSNLNKPRQTLLFTSKNAVRIVLQKYFCGISEDIKKTWQIYCLSGATQKVLLQHFSRHQIAASAISAAILAPQIKKPQQGEIQFFCSNRRRDLLPNFMTKRQIPFREWHVYKTVNTPHNLNDDYNAYLFYSPSAVESFFSANRIDHRKPCFAIGKTTLRAIESAVKNPVIDSEKPDTPHMLAVLKDHFGVE